MIFTWPPPEPEPLPSLGPQLLQWQRENQLVHGPGPRRGARLKLARLYRILTTRIYEVHRRGHELEGRRRWKRVILILRKGSAKTEFAAVLTVGELHPSAPVRTVDWDGDRPIGGGVVGDPFVPMVATAGEQAEDLAYGTLRSILEDEHCGVAPMFHATAERITRVDGRGEARAMAGSPNARDGARTSFQHFDETHRMIRPALREAHTTMIENVPKLVDYDAWTLETTTMWQPGQGSIAELAFEEVRAEVEVDNRETDSLVFWLSASQDHDLDDPEQRMEALLEASGADLDLGLTWSDLHAASARYVKPGTDRAYWRRVWVNQEVSSFRKCVQVDHWAAMAAPGESIGLDEPVVIGFDGGRTRDATVIVAVRLSDGFTELLRVWERPHQVDRGSWKVNRASVKRELWKLFSERPVVRAYFDPHKWEDTIAELEGAFPKVVSPWDTRRVRATTWANYRFAKDTREGGFAHAGQPVFDRHVLAAEKSLVSSIVVDEETGELGWLVQKPADGANVDAHVAAVLGHEARRDAIAAGALAPQKRRRLAVR